MPRHVVLGNGSFLICLDEFLQLRDLYYPYVGELNHVIGHFHRVGIWIDGEFSWLNQPDWTFNINHRTDTLVSESKVTNTKLNVQLTFRDAVLPDKDIFIRQVTVQTITPIEKMRDVRLFFCQDYYLYETDIGDTAFYDPHTQGIIHYKRQVYLLSSGLLNNEYPISDYSCGTKKFHGAEGTWKDAEDGYLSKNTIAQGSVDSALGFHGSITPDKPTMTVSYWIAAGKTLRDVRKHHQMIQEIGCEALLNQTESYWRNWVVSQVNLNLTELPPAISSLFKRSLLTIRTQTDNQGAILAANDTDYFSFSRDTYSYMWPRDGAFVAYTLDQTGHQEMTRPFFRFCRRIFTASYDPGSHSREHQQAFFFHKYTPSGSVGSSWHSWITPDNIPILPIQEDETGLILWSLWNHYQQYRDIEFARKMYESVIIPAANFMVNYRDPVLGLPLPSYDLWEERLGIHTFTVGSIYAGLQAAANFATVFGDAKLAASYREAALHYKSLTLKYLWSEEKQRFYRCIRFNPVTQEIQTDDTVDISGPFALFFFEMLAPDDPKIVANMEYIQEKLWVKTNIGGIARYQNDYYHQISKDTDTIPGNPWIVCTMWLAQWYILKAQSLLDLEPALKLLDWVTRLALPSGLLAEQFNPYTGESISVAPLTWSHASFASTVVLYLNKYKKIAKREQLKKMTITSISHAPAISHTSDMY